MRHNQFLVRDCRCFLPKALGMIDAHSTVMRNTSCARFGLVLCASALAAACSSEALPSGASRAPTSTGKTADELEGFESLHPQGDEKTYYTGFDGTNPYLAPLAFYADSKPEVTVADPSVAEVQGQMTITKALVPDLPDEVDGKMQVIFVKTKSAGQTTITATSGKVTQKAKLKVTQYSADDVAAGQKRYEQGSPACASCHENLGVHNPGMLVDLADETILGIAVEGKSIEKINMETGKVETSKPNKGNHKWSVTKAERTGLMAYLRSRDLSWQRP
jgi:mono/diheme cytochrome c family protein